MEYNISVSKSGERPGGSPLGAQGLCPEEKRLPPRDSTHKGVNGRSATGRKAATFEESKHGDGEQETVLIGASEETKDMKLETPRKTASDDDTDFFVADEFEYRQPKKLKTVVTRSAEEAQLRGKPEVSKIDRSGRGGARSKKRQCLINASLSNTDAQDAGVGDVAPKIQKDLQPVGVVKAEADGIPSQAYLRDVDRLNFSFYVGPPLSKVMPTSLRVVWWMGVVITMLCGLLVDKTNLLPMFCVYMPMLASWIAVRWLDSRIPADDESRRRVGMLVTVATDGKVYGDQKIDVRPDLWKTVCPNPTENTGLLRVVVTYYDFESKLTKSHNLVISVGYFWTLVSTCKNMSYSSATQRDRIASAMNSVVNVNICSTQTAVMLHSVQLAHLYLTALKFNSTVDFPIAQSVSPCDMDIALVRYSYQRLYRRSNSLILSFEKSDKKAAESSRALWAYMLKALLLFMATQITFQISLLVYSNVFHAILHLLTGDYVLSSIVLLMLGLSPMFLRSTPVKNSILMRGLTLLLILGAVSVLCTIWLPGYMNVGIPGQNGIQRLSSSVRTKTTQVTSISARYMLEWTSTKLELDLFSRAWRPLSTDTRALLSMSPTHRELNTYLIGFNPRTLPPDILQLITQPSNLTLTLEHFKISSLDYTSGSRGVMFRQDLQPNCTSTLPQATITVARRDVVWDYLADACLGKCARVSEMDSLISWCSSSSDGIQRTRVPLLLLRVTMPRLASVNQVYYPTPLGHIIQPLYDPPTKEEILKRRNHRPFEYSPYLTEEANALRELNMMKTSLVLPLHEPSMMSIYDTTARRLGDQRTTEDVSWRDMLSMLASRTYYIKPMDGEHT